MNKTNFTLEQIKEDCTEIEYKILELYLLRKKQKEICEQLGVKRGKIDNLVKKYKLTRFRDRSNFTINVNTLSVGNPEIWYYLGVFAADGNLHTTNSGTDIIQFTVKDRDCLEAIKAILQYTGEIKEYDRGFYLGITNKDLIAFTNATFKQDCHRKTSTLTFPETPNRDCLSMFLRGYFDGDGSFRLSKNEKYFRFGIYCDSGEFLEKLYNVLSNIVSEHIAKYGNSIEIASQKGNYQLYTFIYSYDSPYCILRKKERAMQHILAYEQELKI